MSTSDSNSSRLIQWDHRSESRTITETFPQPNQSFTISPPYSVGRRYTSPYNPVDPAPHQTVQITPYPFGNGVVYQAQQLPPQQTAFNPDGFRGRFIAYASYAPLEGYGDKKTGLLFVRKCGAWKLVDPLSFVTVVSGSDGSYETASKYITIHYYIVNNEKTISKKPVKEINRFSEIDLVMPSEA